MGEVVFLDGFGENQRRGIVFLTERIWRLPTTGRAMI